MTNVKGFPGCNTASPCDYSCGLEEADSPHLIVLLNSISIASTPNQFLLQHICLHTYTVLSNLLFIFPFSPSIPSSSDSIGQSQPREGGWFIKKRAAGYYYDGQRRKRIAGRYANKKLSSPPPHVQKERNEKEKKRSKSWRRQLQKLGSRPLRES